MLKFCENCGSLMVPKKVDGTVNLFCNKCEISEKADKDIKLETKINEREKQETVVVASRDIDGAATETKECPECNTKRRIIQWQVQTRSADEAPTTFYKCSYCKHTWRDYGG